MNEKTKAQLREAKDEIDHLHNLCILMRMAVAALDDVNKRAISAGVDTLQTRLSCVLESIRWAEEMADS